MSTSSVQSPGATTPAIRRGAGNGQCSARGLGAATAGVLALLSVIIFAEVVGGAEAKAGADKAPATKPAQPATQPVKKVFRTVFKPGKRATQKTSWSGLFRRAGAEERDLMALVTAYLGDKFPVTLAGSKEPLFWGEMVDGNDDKVQLRVTRPDGTKQVLELARDKAVEVEVGDRVFRLAYSSTSVAAEEQPVVDHVTIIVNHRPKAE
jgi:hypothetical protein